MFGCVHGVGASAAGEAEEEACATSNAIPITIKTNPISSGRADQRITLELRAIEPRVQPIVREQLDVRPAFNDATGVDHEDYVCVKNRR